MLRMNKLADYGTVAMVFLAQNGAGLVSARDIATHTHLGLPTVSKVLKRLLAAGLLVSVRGKAGGYALKHNASDIAVTDILYALDASRGLTACSSEPAACALHQVCKVKNNWRLISQTIEAALESVSLEALATPVIPLKTLNQMKNVVTGVNRVEIT
ncbi:MAG: SUF system Fe-S cluster assembly regulator [Gammaproteobacteria bacterium]|nr:SUF system Fe-S cluster assembly regulator [Gammaproteobacteria bacterium]MCH9715550.1 SUF system Fe-S cluster assembly regulator [Gammaproteobacteria bacterium]MCH9764343.1 SUF system Fe-S cluster assembly regulator [Gammaproteobacteria bacterium]